MIAYLSGAMEFASDEGAAWRNSISFWLNNELGHKTIDPVQESAKIIEKNNAADYREWKSLDPERYANFIKLCVKNDINIVRNKADYIICLWDENVIMMTL